MNSGPSGDSSLPASMTAKTIEAAFAQYRRGALWGLGLLFGSLFACTALILGWRYWTTGALAYPQPATDYFAVVVLAIWGFTFFPWSARRASRDLRELGLVCPHCDRLWWPSLRKKLFATGACPYCRAKF